MRSLLHSISYGVPKAPADDNPWGLKEVKDLGLRSGFDPPDLDRPGRLPMGSSQPEMLPSRGLTSDNDQSPDVQCTGAEPSNQPLGTPHTIDLKTCHICLPRHVHPRPPAAKRARVSFHPDLPVVTQTLITQRGSATRPPKWGLGRTLAKTDRDATAGYRERQGGDGASHKQAQEDVRGPLRYLLPTRCATTRLQTPCGSTACRQ